MSYHDNRSKSYIEVAFYPFNLTGHEDISFWINCHKIYTNDDHVSVCLKSGIIRYNEDEKLYQSYNLEPKPYSHEYEWLDVSTDLKTMIENILTSTDDVWKVIESLNDIIYKCGEELKISYPVLYDKIKQTFNLTE